MSDQNEKQGRGSDDDGLTPPSLGDREWQQFWDIGEYRVEATFMIRNGIELPWPARVDVVGPTFVSRLGGRNLLPYAFMIAETLSRNPIRD